MMEMPLENNNNDAFRSKFKYYKSKKPKPSLSEVLILNDDGNNVDTVSFIPKEVAEDKRAAALGLSSTLTWKVYSFKQHPGLLMIRNPFTPLGQRYWSRRCLEEYPKKPNKRNIDIEVDVQDWWSECFKLQECDKILQKKLRWTTLGYHHNWDTKVYTDENRSPFPEDLSELSDVVAGYLGFSGYQAQAAIVNYYHMDSTLSPHTDHSEVNLQAPLLSFSFGQSAIFLIGGTDKSVDPTAILLNSGDILVMSEQARLCYHAVPKILPASNIPWNHTEEVNLKHSLDAKFKYITNVNQIVTEMNRNLDSTQWNRFNNYISESRINMNVRQVLKGRQNTLKDLVDDT
ncbi:nucleic acid dioxygenase ALKBH1 [Plutella xylostella]|uniref:nucleic acid dioxygenase ALKBH1 n=1 Tax=Plutella xylostella TaxID=51655 RepID=UPI002032E81F|nr:nucleic acid dioxygenase ALKBH1 [Plutella xylostella]